MRIIEIIWMLIVLVLLFGAPVYAQKDQMQMGEAFGTAVIKKGKMKTKAVASQKKPEPMKTQESLEISREPMKHPLRK